MSPLLMGLAGSAVPANVKIGVIDIDNTLSSTPAGRRANEQFERARKAKQSELDKKQQELKRAEADLDKQKQVMKPESYQAKREELEKQFVDLQQTYVKLEKDLAGERTKLIQDLLKQAGPKIEAIAKSEGVSIIVDREAVVWASPDVDLTPKLNAEMK
ncbi:MAG: OmpH family outer membrane protein [Acidobacteriota bacterium]